MVKIYFEVVVLFNVFTHVLSDSDYYDEELLMEENFGSQSLGVFRETDDCDNTFEVIHFTESELYLPSEDSNGYMMIARDSGCMGIPTLNLPYGCYVEMLLKCSKPGKIIIQSHNILMDKKRVIFNTTIEREQCWRKYVFVLESYVDTYFNIQWRTATVNETGGGYYVLIDYIRIVGPLGRWAESSTISRELDHDPGVLVISSAAAVVLLPAACVLVIVVVCYAILKH